jgi:tripartite-type tricarboxylate transporter receptor subunit TctC
VKQYLAAAVVLVLGSGYSAFDGQAFAQEDFFRGKSIKLMIGTGPGGGYDTYGRLVARHIGRHIPGNPSVVPQNQPGASSLALTNFLANGAPRDGTTIGIVNQAMPIEQFLKSPNTNYDVNQFSWIGRVSSAVEMAIVWHTVPVETIQDVMTRETLMGGTGPTSSTEFVPRLLNNLAGTKFRIISGFGGTSDIALAMERGEVEGSATPLESLTSYRADWVREKKIKILVQYTRERDPELPDIPTMVELGLTDEGRQILSLYASGADIGRSFLAPPGLPEERVRILRAAFEAMLDDPDFIADATKLGIPRKPLPGKELQQLVAHIGEFPTALIAKARAAREPPR